MPDDVSLASATEPGPCCTPITTCLRVFWGNDVKRGAFLGTSMPLPSLFRTFLQQFSGVLSVNFWDFQRCVRQMMKQGPSAKTWDTAQGASQKRQSAASSQSYAPSIRAPRIGAESRGTYPGSPLLLQRHPGTGDKCRSPIYGGQSFLAWRHLTPPSRCDEVPSCFRQSGLTRGFI